MIKRFYTTEIQQPTVIDKFKRKKPYPLNVEIKIHRVKGPDEVQPFRIFHFHSVSEEKLKQELLKLINDTSWNWSPEEK